MPGWPGEDYGYDYGNYLRIVNPTREDPERIEYQMIRDINDLPRIK